MNTLPIHAPSHPHLPQWVHDALTHLKEIAHKYADAYAEAQQMAREADKRYPFTYWS
jgi:hypothetical protein